MTVVVDDRGKMVFITDEEMKKVADLIQTEGRVSIQRLSKLCGNIIDMNSSSFYVCCFFQ